VHTNRIHKNNDDDDPTPIFIGPHKTTTTKHGCHRKKVRQVKVKSEVLKHMHFNE
jgi:hypothetical protein